MKENLKFLLIAILCQCCSLKHKHIEIIVWEWSGKEITVPNQIEYTFLGRDTICSDLWDKTYKIFIYFDSIGCSICKMGLSNWIELIEICEKQKMDVAFLFVVHSSNYHMFNIEIIENQFNYPIIFDYNNNFDKLNHFPPDPYRTFLLDKDNKVILIGSPINNNAMWELYKRVITQSQ